MMTVYHLKYDVTQKPWLRCDISTIINFKKNFEMVALCAGKDDIDAAFQMTNSIDDSWWKNTGVSKGDKDSYRSTSIGDVVETSDGKFWMVDSYGWEAVEPYGNHARTRIKSILKNAAHDIALINHEG